jgi:hypothetical protein
MYTIGTSAIAWIRTQTTDTALLSALEGKLVGYVGTLADRTGDATVPATYVSPYSVFFECEAVSGQPHTIAVPITSVKVMKPKGTSAAPSDWELAGNLDQAQVTNILLPAGAIKNGMYQFSRGNIADIDNVLKADGLPYYARDEADLHIWDSEKGAWVRLTYGAIPVGSVVTYHASTAMPDDTHYLRCDGAVVLITQYQELYGVVGKIFEDPNSPTDSTHFRLPLVSNGIIRIKQ